MSVRPNLIFSCLCGGASLSRARGCAVRVGLPGHFLHTHATLYMLGLSMLAVAPVSLAANGLSTPAIAPIWAVDASTSLRSDGFAVLPAEARIAVHLVEEAKAETTLRLDVLLNAIDSIGIETVEQHYSFSEINHRARLRWDLRMPDSSEAFHTLCQHAFEQATPVLQELTGCEQPRLVMSGAVVSRPGASAQHVHTDGDERGLFTIFVPLVDIEAESDGTSFLAGSHLETDVLARTAKSDEGVMEFDAETMTRMISPACAAGGLLCFDYRTAHRGRANAGRERAVAYIVVSTEEGVTDDSNFDTMSVLHDLRHPDMPAHMAETVWDWE